MAHSNLNTSVGAVLTSAEVNRCLAADGSGNFSITGNSITLSSVIISEGGTIGQAAGPLLTFDDTNNYLEITGCKVGIGISAPEANLHLKGAASTVTTLQLESATSQYAPQILFDGVVGANADNLLGNISASWDTHTNIVASIRFESGVDTANKDDGLISFWTSSASSTPAERARISPAGYVGVNTVVPAARLHVVEGTTNAEHIALRLGTNNNGSSTIATLQFVEDEDGTPVELARIRAYHGKTLALATNGVNRFEMDTNGNIVINETGADSDFRIEGDTNTHAFFLQGSDGYVGINTSAPSSLLSVNGPVGTGTACAGILTLATNELTIVAGDELGRINFRAPLESDGTDAILPGASIWAVAEDTFSATVNKTSLVFATGASEAAIEKLRLNSDGNLDHNNNRMVKNQTIQDNHPEPYIYLDGIDDIGTITDATEFAELFKYGGTYICDFKALTAGESNTGVFFSKVHSLAYTGATGTIALTIDFSTTNGIWTSPATTLNKNSSIGISYDGSDVANNPILIIDGKEITMTETQTPVGIITTDVGTDLKLFNNAGGTATFHGHVRKQVFLNRAYTLNELISATSSPQKSIDWVDEGGQNNLYVLDASAGTDGWAAYNGTASGNNDGISDGSISKDNVLKYYADAANDQHFIYSADLGLKFQKTDRIKLSCYVPSGQTAVDGFAIFYFDGVTIVYLDGWGLDGAGVGNNGAWVDINVDQEIALAAVNGFLYVSALDGTNPTFVGANSSSDDIVYVHGVVIDQLGATLVLKSDDIITDKDGIAYTWKDSSGNANPVIFSGSPEAGNRSEQQHTEWGTWTPMNGDFGTWTSPVFTATYKKSNGLCHLMLELISGTIDPGAAGKYITGAPFAPSFLASGQATSSTFADHGAVLMATGGNIYFSNDFGAVTDLVFSITYQTEG